ncbi:hypothetical protein V6N13_051382 [Hibiscus sabdariffa]
MSAKYFPGGNILEARRGDKTSFIWSNIYEGLCRWGGSVQIQFSSEYGDNGPDPIRCNEFMLNGGEELDSRKIRQVFNESDANAIPECPINPIREDL